MNCFEWENKAVDHLDGTLMGPAKRAADEHLEECKTCNERYKHYRIILSSISNQPRSTLPVPIRKSPFSSVLPRLDLQNKHTRWDKTPWYIRTGVEGVGVIFIILLTVAMIPRIRSLYERNVDRKMDIYNIPDTEQDSEKIPLARGKISNIGEVNAAAISDEFNGEVEEEENDSSEKIHVGNAEIWRFNLKTDSPHDLRNKVVKVLTELGVSPQTPGIGGVEAPGGIQFDLLLPQTVISNLKNQLQKIATPLPALAQHPAIPAIEQSAPHETFTWYKNKSRQKIPVGKARVVIWLSQV